MSYRIRTLTYSDYGTLTVNLRNASAFPIIVDLVKSDGSPDKSVYLTENKPVLFKYISPGEYYVRAIYDTNANGRGDPGHWLRKQQAELVFYMEGPVEMNSNWIRESDFILPE